MSRDRVVGGHPKPHILTGLGVARDRFSRFLFDLRRRSYSTLALPCECV